MLSSITISPGEVLKETLNLSDWAAKALETPVLPGEMHAYLAGGNIL